MFCVRRHFKRSGDYDTLQLLYDDIPDALSQLIRTAFIARDGYKFIVSDFSAIEARVLAYLAGETWRSKVFAEGKDIYHDELIIECSPGVDLKAVCKQMGRSPDWMPDILLRADGYETDWYRKD